jgi:4-hydroxy-tetrahydrodipicolinate reductase
MGQAVLERIRHQRPGGLELASAVDDPASAFVGDELAPGITVTADLDRALAAADVYVDFTTPAATAAAARAAAATRVAAVVGTTGLDTEAEAALSALAAVAPVVIAPNFSLGVNLMLGLAEQAARALGDDFDAEIVELHHRHKRDAPSGTAKAIAAAIATGRDTDLSRVATYERAGEVGPRREDEIGVFAIRGGDVVGEHTAYFFGDGERIEITHRATSRAIFAAGAVRAATWAVNQPPGLYGMRDVLGL